jgi:hypothetical protein
MVRNVLANPIEAALRTAQTCVEATITTFQARETRTQVYIGLNDRDTKEQRFDTDRYVSILKHVCVQYGTPFSFDVVHGGYFHDNGEYVEENTIVLTFIDVPQKTIDEIAKDLCVFFRQESVLITSGRIQSRMVRAGIEPVEAVEPGQPGYPGSG